LRAAAYAPAALGQVPQEIAIQDRKNAKTVYPAPKGISAYAVATKAACASSPILADATWLAEDYRVGSVVALNASSADPLAAISVPALGDVVEDLASNEREGSQAVDPAAKR